MDKDFDKTGTFSLNLKKGPKVEDWHDDYSGSIFLKGKEYWLGAVKKEGPYGEFISGKIGKEKKPKDSKVSAPKTPTKQDLNKFFNDDVPY